MIRLVLIFAGVMASTRLTVAARKAPGLDRARALRARSRVRLAPVITRRLGAALQRADVDVTPDDALRGWLVAIAAGGALAFAVTPTAVPIVVGGVLVGGPVALWWARDRGDARAVAALPGALDRVAAGLRAGTTVRDGLVAGASGGGPLAPDLGRVDARTRLGVGLVDALAQWTRERPGPAVRAAAGALALAVTVGGAAAHALEGLAESLRVRDATLREAQALSAQARLSATVVGAAPLLYLAFVSLADPTSLDTLVATGTGRVCLVVGLGLELLAALWMRTLLRRTA